MIEICLRCQRVGEDRRTLVMSCLYAMEELGIPFTQEDHHSPTVRQKSYTLRVCKDCRASWMEAIKNWFHSCQPTTSPGTGIFVRRNGANVEITEEEWAALYPGRTPVRYKP